MTTLVLGGSGATGRLLVEELLNRGEKVRVVVRSLHKFSETIKSHKNLSVTCASILDLSDVEIGEQVKGCGAVACLLGHTISFMGMYGHPRRLVTDATRRLCLAVKKNSPNKKVKFVLMNTAGNRNKQLSESISLAEKLVLGVVRCLLPPHSDNEMAADYLASQVGLSSEAIEWVVVRPDRLLNELKVSKYTIHPSPIRSSIFNSGVTSRINVSHFMADLIDNGEVWGRWQGKMPVIYNSVSNFK